MGLSPFSRLSGGVEQTEAIPVHHESVKGPLHVQVGDEENQLMEYDRRMASGETLHPDEFEHYNDLIKEKSHDSMLEQKLNKQHGQIERRSLRLKKQRAGVGPRSEGSELMNEYGGGQQ